MHATNKHVTPISECRSVIRRSRTLLAGVLIAATVSAESQVLTDPGLDSGTHALTFFTDPVLNQWAQENATLIIGSDNGVTAFAGDGMIRLAQTGGVVSDFRQRVDTSALAADIDAGLVSITTSAMLNATVAGVGRTVAVAFDANMVQLGTASSICLASDGDVATWEASSARLQLPVGTRFIEARVTGANSQLGGGNFMYADEVRLAVEIAIDSQALTDPGFDSGSQPLTFFTDPVLDQWAQENAVLITGADNGVTPFAGDGMIRLAASGGVVSDLRQRVSTSALAASIDAGLVSVTTSAMFNATVADAGRTLAFAFDANMVELGSTFSVCPQTDGDVTTWQASSTRLHLPPGTRFVEARLTAANSLLAGGDFFYADEARLSIDASPACVIDVCDGLAGTSGVPELSVQLSFAPNAIGDLELSAAQPNAPAVLFVALGPAGAGAPFKGGILKPVPILLTVGGLITSSTGEIALPLATGVNLGPLSLVMQYAVLDAGATQNVALSNALQLDLY